MRNISSIRKSEPGFSFSLEFDRMEIKISHLICSSSDLRSELCMTRLCSRLEAVSLTQSTNLSKSEMQNSGLSRNAAFKDKKSGPLKKKRSTMDL